MASSEAQGQQFQAGQLVGSLAGMSEGAPGGVGAGMQQDHDPKLLNVIARVLRATPKSAQELLRILPSVPALLNDQDPNKQTLRQQLMQIITIVEYYKKCLRTGENFDESKALSLPIMVQLPANLNVPGRQVGAQQQQGQMQGVMYHSGQPVLTQSQPQIQPIQPHASSDYLPPIPQLTGITDPNKITETVSVDPAAHKDPGPANFSTLRPTLTGGMVRGLQDGTPALIHQPMDDPSMFMPDIRPTSLRKNTGAEQHVRKKIQEMIASVDSNVKVDPEAEDLLLEIADEFIDSVANFTCRLTKHRKGDMVDIKDLQLHLEMHHGIRIPGFTVDAPTQGHGSASTLAAAAAAQAQAGATDGARPGGSGAKKGASNAGSAASMKRSSRLAAVTQAKKDARLL